MKHSAPQSAKFKRFLRRLRSHIDCNAVSVETIAIGILERLWHATIISAPQGDIGKVDDETLCELTGWHGDPQALIDLLVETGWLDVCPVHRLLIHDWAEHSPTFVKGFLKRYGREFSIKHDITKPNKPNHQSRGSEKTKQAAKQDRAFVKFWEVVHRKEGKEKAKTSFYTAVQNVAKEKRKPADAAANWIIERMKTFAKSPQAKHEIKGKLHPSTWLNQGRYDDDDSIWNETQDGASSLNGRHVPSTPIGAGA